MGCINERFAFCSVTLIIFSSPPPEQALSANLQFDVGFTATSILHPATYLNKVLIASQEGDMQLWNIRTQCVRSFAIKILLNPALLAGLVYTSFLTLNCAHYRLSRI